jgi:cell division ATPase FtsA
MAGPDRRIDHRECERWPACQPHVERFDRAGRSADFGKSDIQKVLKAGIARAANVDRTVLHMLPVDHVLDGERGIVDPRGMIGSELTLNMHVLTADAAPLRNVEMCINRAHI